MKSKARKGARPKGLVPRLRFPKFRDAESWMIRGLGGLYRFKRSYPLTRGDLGYTEGGIRVIHYGDIHTRFNPSFDVDKEEVPRISKDVAVARMYKDNYCSEGDLVFADASEDLHDIGKCLEIVNLSKSKMVAGLHCIIASRLTDEIVLGFGAFLFQSRYIRDQIQREAQGTKVLGISASRLSRVLVPFPSYGHEQKKISDCLSSLDSLIVAQAQQLEVLKERKKALLQNLFPREGERVPRLRFPEFRNAGEWRQILLAECLDFQTGYPFRSSLFTEQKVGLRLIRNRDLRSETDHIFYKGDYSVEFMVDTGDLLVGMDGDFSPMIWNGGEALLNQRVGRVTTKNGIPMSFLFYVLGSCMKKMEDITAATTVKHLSHNDVERLVSLFPSMAEQKKIGECLYALDDLIAKARKKSEKLQSHKRGLMQQLFPPV